MGHCQGTGQSLPTSDMSPLAWQPEKRGTNKTPHEMVDEETRSRWQDWWYIGGIHVECGISMSHPARYTKSPSLRRT